MPADNKLKEKFDKPKLTDKNGHLTEEGKRLEEERITREEMSRGRKGWKGLGSGLK